MSPTDRPRTRLRLPHWTAHPGFGVAALLAVAVLLIAHGEPQPSSRQSGKSVTVSGSPSQPTQSEPILVIHQGSAEAHQQGRTTRIALPADARALSVLTNRGLSVVLADVGDRQHAFAVTAALRVSDLGPADAVVPAVQPGASVIVESATVDPGRLPSSSSTATTSTATAASPSGTPDAPGATRDYLIRRYNARAQVDGQYEALPTGTRIGADTSVGIVVWRPLSLLFDGTLALEPLSAAATLIRPDGSARALGPVYPLAASPNDLLVWDVQRRQFGLMPLEYATSTATTVPSPSASTVVTETASGPHGVTTSGTGTRIPRSPADTPVQTRPSPTPTLVPGVRWFGQTRGFTVTGPATFAPDGSSFAVYAKVGSRRRLVVAQVGATLTDQIEVLALAPPAIPPSPAASSSPSASTPAADGTTSPSPTISVNSPTFTSDGYPIVAPLSPLWWNKQVIGVGTDGTVVSYQPGGAQASLLDLGVTGIESLAQSP